MNAIAVDIRQRANRKGLSMAYVMRRAGASPNWFLYFGRKLPRSVEIYLKINEVLDENP